LPKGDAGEAHYPEITKAVFGLQAKTVFFVGGGVMKAKTPCEHDPNSLSV